MPENAAPAAAALRPVLATLTALYAVALLYALVQLARLQRAARGFTVQKLVHLLVAACALLRCLFFSLVPLWDGVYFYVRMSGDSPADTALYVLEELPSLLLLTMFSQQLLVWARSYHMATNTVATYTGRVVGAVWGCNAAAYAIQILVWALYDHTTQSRPGAPSVDADAWSLLSAIVHAAEFLATAVALTLYGIGVHRTVHAAPVSLQMRAKQMRSIVLVTATCTAAFLVRSGALVAASYAAFTDAGGFDDELTAGDLAGSALFFIATELLPLAIVLRNNGRIPGANRRSAPGVGSPGGSKRGGGAGGSGGGGGARGGGVRSFFSLGGPASPGGAGFDSGPNAAGLAGGGKPKALNVARLSFAERWLRGASVAKGPGAGERTGLLAASADPGGELAAARTAGGAGASAAAGAEAARGVASFSQL
jgi:uncharacterized membrane protein YgcG